LNEKEKQRKCRFEVTGFYPAYGRFVTADLHFLCLVYSLKVFGKGSGENLFSKRFSPGKKIL
jgi:hypothetical protein